MKVSDIRLEMELNGVDFEDITEILEICKPKAYDTQAVDEELQKRGYEPLFALDYEDDDDDFDVVNVNITSTDIIIEIEIQDDYAGEIEVPLEKFVDFCNNYEVHVSSKKYNIWNI